MGIVHDAIHKSRRNINLLEGSNYKDTKNGAVRYNLFELVGDIASATSVSEVWKAYLGSSSRVGLPFGIACYMPITSNAPFEIVAASTPDTWLKNYQGKGLQRGCLITTRVLNGKKTFEWRMSDWTGANYPRSS